METTKNNISEKASKFLKNLSEYLELKVIFFGSIQRYDYFPGFSDIDIDLFSDNVNSTLIKLQNFLQIPKKNVKKFLWKLINGKMAYGYKILYKKPKDNFIIEFSIYDVKFKEDVLFEHRRKMELPFYISWLLIILKFLYYKLELIDKKTFTYYKRIILTKLIGLPDDKFLVLDSDPDKTSKKIYNLVVHGLKE